MNTERDELMLDSMGPSAKGGFEIKTHAGGPETAETLLFIADSMRSALDGHNAPNYLEMELTGSDRKRYIMTLQRAGKITPHGARVKAEEALEGAEHKLKCVAGELKTLGKNLDSWESEGHTTATIRFLRQWLGRAKAASKGAA